jgi:MFS family permease
MTNIRRTERVLLGAVFTMEAGGSVIFALMGNLQDEFGFNDGGLGLIAAAGFLASFVMQIVVAPYADRGHAKRLLIIATVLALVGNALFAAGSSLIVFIVARLVAGAGSGLFLPPARALIASLDEKGVSERLGAMGGVALAGFVTGPVIGGFLVGPLGLRWPFIIFSISALISLMIVSTQRLPLLIPSTHPQRLAFGLLRQRQVLVPILFLISLALPVGMYDALWDRYLTDLGASDIVVGLSLAAYALPFVLLSRFGGRLADRSGKIKIAFIAVLFVAPLTALYGWFATPLMPIVLGIIESVAQSAGSPAGQGMLAEGAPEGRASAAQGLAGACNQLVAATVAILATWGYGHISPMLLFSLAGLSVLVLGSVARLLARNMSVSAQTLNNHG